MRHYCRCLRPTRLVWFIVGAVSATFCYEAHERRHHRRDGRLRWHGRIPRHANAAPGATDTTPLGPCRYSRCTRDTNTRKEWRPCVLPLPMPTNRAEEERQRILECGKQVVETVSTSTFSHSTPILSESLSRRLWMHRRLLSSPCSRRYKASKL